MRSWHPNVLLCIFLMVVSPGAFAQEAEAQSTVSTDNSTELQKLLERLAEDEARIKDLEQKLAIHSEASRDGTSVASDTTPKSPEPATPPSQPPATASNTSNAEPASSDTESSDDSEPHGHMVELPGGGPALKIQGYFDFNFGVGSDANTLVFPLGAPAHATFQMGELDLMLMSQLSQKFSFMSELVFSSGTNNQLGIDIERYVLSYKANKYLQVGFGRYHTAIGYYNTEFHHGTWFQTATGRPFMYFFEDNGGLLPVHSIGATATGLVPGTDAVGLHWVAEVANGRASSSLAEPTQNFYSDRNHKAYNLAAYIAPQAINGLQIGASYYKDRIIPPGVTPADQTIASLYAVYVTPKWELLNEGVLLRNHLENQGPIFNTPLAYSQFSRKFGAWRPYFRYQYVNSSAGDPINIYTGRYMGPSAGLRWDFTDYAAFKLQYNRLDQRNSKPSNGLDAQLAFTF